MRCPFNESQACGRGCPLYESYSEQCSFSGIAEGLLNVVRALDRIEDALKENNKYVNKEAL